MNKYLWHYPLNIVVFQIKKWRFLIRYNLTIFIAFNIIYCFQAIAQTTNYLPISGGTLTGPLNIGLSSKILIDQAATNNFINLYSYGDTGQNMIAISPTGQISAAFATRTSDQSASTASAVGSISWAYNDNTAHPNFAWGTYAECRRYNGAGVCDTTEANVTNFGNVVDFDPYLGALGNGQATINQWLPSGGGCTLSSPCYNPATGKTDQFAVSATAAIVIQNNGSNYENGIIFSRNALAGNDGGSVGQKGTAILMPEGDAIDWGYCTNTASYPINCLAKQIGGEIVSTMNSVGNGSRINFSNTGLQVEDVTAQAAWLRVIGTSATKNGVQINAATVGGSPAIGPFGVDGNQQLYISGRGTGSLVALTGNSGQAFAIQNSAAACTYTPATSSPIVACSSDQRLKHEIVDAEPVLPSLAALRVRDYIENATGHKTIGVIAQEVAVQHPAMVHNGLDGFLSVDEVSSWELVKAIQELAVRDAAFSLRLSALEHPHT